MADEHGEPWSLRGHLGVAKQVRFRDDGFDMEMVMRHLGTGMLILFLAALPARAQEPWDSSFQLIGGTVSGAKDHGVGQDRSLGISMRGAYPLFRQGFVVVEGGYRYLPTDTVQTSGSEERENKTDAYFGGLLYRHMLFEGDVYAQIGARYTQSKAMQRVRNFGGMTGHDKELRGTGAGVVFGVGYRFTEKLSLEINASSFQSKNLDGTTKRLPTLDVALGIHLGK